jgi:hypothetical protein
MTNNLADMVSVDIGGADMGGVNSKTGSNIPDGKAQSGKQVVHTVDELYWVAAAGGYKLMAIAKEELHLFEYTTKYPADETSFSGNYSHSNIKGDAA